tara:strand:+ start:5937 stop:6347 length:411 start_codon:yes stop_codon:yes gene_type:complete
MGYPPRRRGGGYKGGDGASWQIESSRRAEEYEAQQRELEEDNTCDLDRIKTLLDLLEEESESCERIIVRLEQQTDEIREMEFIPVEELREMQGVMKLQILREDSNRTSRHLDLSKKSIERIKREILGQIESCMIRR